MKPEESFRVALRSFRANAVPIAVLWLVAGLTVAGYYRVPAVRSLLEPLSVWQCRSGWIAAFLNRAVFCGLVPGVFLVFLPALRPPKVGRTVLAYCLWGGLWGILGDGFFLLQSAAFGDGHDFATLAKKTLVDQLVWTVAICTPANAVFFPWVEGGFAKTGSVRRGFFPMLFSNWIVWMPVMVAVYAFPLPLQVQLVGLAGALWMLVALRIGRRKEGNRR